MLHFELRTCDERFGSNDEISQSRCPLRVIRVEFSMSVDVRLAGIFRHG